MDEDRLKEIDEALQSGKTPEEVARTYGLSRTAMQYQLLASGKRIVTYRRLENTVPAETPRELAAA